MERFVGFAKDDFIGKAATLAAQQAGVRQKCVYFEVEPGDCDVRGGEAVVLGDEAIGVTTSGGFGHRSGKSLGFAYVRTDAAQPGTAFQVMLLGQLRNAKVLAAPAYDPENARLKA